MNTESRIIFESKWKELLIGTINGNQFTIELTMGVLTAYLPTSEKWDASAPDWARGKWQKVRADLTAWCEEHKIPLIIEENAWVNFDKP